MPPNISNPLLGAFEGGTTFDDVPQSDHWQSLGEAYAPFSIRRWTL